MSPWAVSGTVFGCVFAGALLGLLLRRRLPEHHRSTDSKDVVKLTMGVIATLTSMVLGLLVASAKSSFDAQRIGVSQLAANIIVLDRALALYGMQTQENAELLRVQKTREFLREAVDDVIHQNWPDEAPQAERAVAKAGAGKLYHDLFERIATLEPKNEAQRTLQVQALKSYADAGQLRWLLFAQRAGSTIPVPFLIVMVVWMVLLLGSFALFAPGNATTILSLAVCAMAISSAIFLILELDRPFRGLIRISGDPLHSAMENLGR